jgi:type III secretion protein T
MYGDYVQLYLNSSLALGQPESALTLLLLTLARIFPIIFLSPFFGAKLLPHPTKVVLGIALFAVFLPKLLTVITTPLDFNLGSAFLILKELFVGFIIGFLISMPFNIVSNAGIIIDHQRGGASLMVNDPTIQNQSSPLGTLFNYLLILFFFAINGPFLFIEAIMNSYQILPPDKFLPPEFFNKDNEFWRTQISLLNQVMVISIQLASPALIAILMTDFFLGVANRLAPQVQITFLGMPIKSLIALLVIAIGFKLFNQQMVKETYKWLALINQTILELGTGNVVQAVQ